MYGYICPDCGDRLDPGERCDCRKEKEQAVNMIENLVVTEKDGQMIIREAIA